MIRDAGVRFGATDPLPNGRAMCQVRLASHDECGGYGGASKTASGILFLILCGVPSACVGTAICTVIESCIASIYLLVYNDAATITLPCLLCSSGFCS